MLTTSSPGSMRCHIVTKFASEPPLVTSMWSAVAPGYIAAMRSRSSTVPFDWG